jgi:hypothetical protein
MAGGQLWERRRFAVNMRISQSSEAWAPPNRDGGEPMWPDSLPNALLRVSSSTRGLTDAEALRRLAVTGPNAIGPDAEGHPIALIVAQFRSPLVLILIAAAGLTLVVGEVSEALIIVGIVLASAALGFAQESAQQVRWLHCAPACRSQPMSVATERSRPCSQPTLFQATSWSSRRAA